MSRTLSAIVALLAAAASAPALAEPIAFTFEQALYVGPNDTKLKQPEGIACGASGVVVADTGNGRLLTYSLRDGRLAAPVEAKATQLTVPVSVQIDSKGNILALDAKTRKIVKLDSSGAFQSVVEIRSAGGAGVLPGAFKLDAADNLYVLDLSGRRIVVADASGTARTRIELPKQGLFTDVAVDATGIVYAIDASGATLWSADKGATTMKALTKSMSDRMNFPAYITVTRGKIFLVDQHGNGVVALGLDGAFLGRQLSIGWNEGLVYYPSQLCVNDASQVFLTDRYNNRVQQFSLPR